MSHAAARSSIPPQTVTRHDEARLFHVALTQSRRRPSQCRARRRRSRRRVIWTSSRRGPGRGSALHRGRADNDPRRRGRCPTPHRNGGTDLPTGRCGERAAGALAHLARVGVRRRSPEWWGCARSATTGRAWTMGPWSKGLSVGARRLRRMRGSVAAHWSRWSGAGRGLGRAGTLVHEVLAQCGDADVATLGARLDDGWARLGLAPGWISRAKRGDAGRMLEPPRLISSWASPRAGGGWRRNTADEPGPGPGRILAWWIGWKPTPTGGCGSSTSRPAAQAQARGEGGQHPQLGAYQEAVERGAFGPGAVSAGPRSCNSARPGSAHHQRGAGAGAVGGADEPGCDLIGEAATTMAGATYRAIQAPGAGPCQSASCPVHAEGRCWREPDVASR